MSEFCDHCGRKIMSSVDNHTATCIAAIYFDLNRDKS